MAGDLVLFYVFAALAVGSSLAVIGQSHPIYSVLLLIASFGALAGLYVLLDAPFVAVTQIIVYAGAIMVLFLFVVMLLNVPREDPHDPHTSIDAHGARGFGAALAAMLCAELVWALFRSNEFGGDLAELGGVSGWSMQEIGRVLYTDYGLAFEATSVLILVAMVGAVVLARRHTREEVRQAAVDQPPDVLPADAGPGTRDGAPSAEN